jgi:hypothetical protein
MLVSSCASVFAVFAYLLSKHLLAENEVSVGDVYNVSADDG